MRIFGLLFVIVAIGLAIFFGFILFKEQDRILSPIPQENGVKVIFVTPTP